jgi:large-conductance mechanosensitive channel
MAERKTRKSTPSYNPGVVRLEEPSSRRGHKQTSVVREIVPVETVSGFFNFLREHTVVTLAVGFAIASQAQVMIKQFIASFIDPLYGLLFSEKLSAKFVTLHYRGRVQQFGWGQFTYTFLDFMFVMIAIYTILKLFNLDKLDKPIKNPEEDE